MKKQINTEHIEGRIYEFDLEVKQVKNKESKNFGMDFIAGTLDVAVDEDGMNVVQVHYTYVSPTTSKGNANRTFNTLKKIIDTGKCWIADGKDEATMVSIDTSLALNDFLNKCLTSQKISSSIFFEFMFFINVNLNLYCR